MQASGAFAGIDVSAFGPYLTVTCMTLHGRLHLALSTAEPLVTREQARVMLDRIISELRPVEGGKGERVLSANTVVTASTDDEDEEEGSTATAPDVMEEPRAE